MSIGFLHASLWPRVMYELSAFREVCDFKVVQGWLVFSFHWGGVVVGGGCWEVGGAGGGMDPAQM